MLASIVAVVFASPTFFIYALICYVWSNVQRILLKVLGKIGFSSWSTGAVKVHYILHRKKFVEVDIASPHNFLCLQWGSKPLTSLLAKNVTPYCFHGYHVYFVETPSGVNLYGDEANRHGLYHVQWKNAKKLLAVSVKDYMIYVRKMMRPDADVLFMTNTGRCGATELTGLLKDVPSVVTVCEPDIFSSLALSVDRSELKPQAIGYLFSASFKLFAHLAATEKKAKTVVIRGRPACLDAVPIIHKYVPWVQHLFMYGQGSRTVQSMRSVFRNTPSLHKNIEGISKVIGVNLKGQDVRDVDSLMCLSWAQMAARYKEYRRLKIPIYSIRNEDLAIDPSLCIQSIVDIYGLRLNDDEMDELLEKVQKRIWNRQASSPLSGQSKMMCEVICRRMGVPSLFSKESLPGSIIGT